MSEQEKHEYLISWGWESEPHEAGFNVYVHRRRFEGRKYKLDRAYEVMKAAEPSMEPVLSISYDDPLFVEKVRAVLNPIVMTPRQSLAESLSKIMGTTITEDDIEKSSY